jgi:tetratricopeptide (TPR) repeat protein
MESSKPRRKNALTQEEIDQIEKKSANLQKLLTCFQSDIKIDPNFGLAYLLSGKIYVRLGQFDRAIFSFAQAIRCNIRNDIMEQDIDFSLKNLHQTNAQKHDECYQHIKSIQAEGINLKHLIEPGTYKTNINLFTVQLLSSPQKQNGSSKQILDFLKCTHIKYTEISNKNNENLDISLYQELIKECIGAMSTNLEKECIGKTEI